MHEGKRYATKHQFSSAGFLRDFALVPASQPLDPTVYQIYGESTNRQSACLHPNIFSTPGLDLTALPEDNSGYDPEFHTGSSDFMSFDGTLNTASQNLSFSEIPAPSNPVAAEDHFWQSYYHLSHNHYDIPAYGGIPTFASSDISTFEVPTTTPPVDEGDFCIVSSAVQGSNSELMIEGCDGSRSATASGDIGGTSGQAVQSKKPRIVCNEIGCRQSFNRRADLKRHEKTLHSSGQKFYCIVKDCNRNSVSFNREDKFLEHMTKKHSTNDYVDCPKSGCGEPNLRLSHYLYHLFVTHSGDLKLVAKRHVKVIKRFEMKCLVETCGHLEKPLLYDSHWRTHDILERQLTPRDIGVLGMFGIYLQNSKGCITCPVCRQQICQENDWQEKFQEHLVFDHTFDERELELRPLARMLRLLDHNSPWMSTRWLSTTWLSIDPKTDAVRQQLRRGLKIVEAEEKSNDS